MDLKHLRHAVGLADVGNFTMAADHLAISQSALSRSIQALELDLGLALFTRRPGGVVVTEEGMTVLAQARMILHQASSLKLVARQLAKGEVGRVRIGLGPMFSRLVEPMLAACWKPGEAVDVQIHILPVESLVSSLLGGEIDFFVADARAAAGKVAIETEGLGTALTGYFVRPEHPLAEKRGLRISDLRHYPRTNPNLPRTRIELDEVIQASSETHAGRLSCENLDFLVRFTYSSDALLLAVRGAIANELDSGELVELDIPELQDWKAQIGLASLAGSEWSLLSARYAQSLKTLLARHWVVD